MSIINSQPRIGAAGQSTGFKIERSLRFNSADSAYLNRTPASAGNRRTWTWSGWVKLSESSTGVLFAAEDAAGNASPYTAIYYINNRLELQRWGGSSYNIQVSTNNLLRDFSAWYHFVVAVDTTQATSANRVKLYINGVETSYNTATYPTQNFDTDVNFTQRHALGCLVRVSPNNFTGFSNQYLTEVNFIDGSTPTTTTRTVGGVTETVLTQFGEFDTDTGVWKPKAYSGSYGTNGFYLKFADNSGTTSTTLGKDSSGNGNNWTPNNFSVTAGAGNDSLVDTPTPYGTDTGAGGEVRGNYCTLSPIYALNVTYNTPTNGNLDVALSNNSGSYGTFSFTTGKWYWEITVASAISSAGYVGLMDSTFIKTDNTWSSQARNYVSDGSKYNGSTSAYGATWGNGDIIGVAVNMDAGTIVFYKNGSSQGTAFSDLVGKEWKPMVWAPSGSYTLNFGQRPFAYTAPSGFKALCTQNLPTPTIGATATTRADDYFDTSLYSGNSSTQTITNSGMQPDFLWLKRRDSGGTHHYLIDAVRGTNKLLFSSLTNAESTDSTYLTSFNSNGFTLGAGDTGTNGTGATYVGWQWKANGAGSSNTQGSITSTVSANTTAGFSIVTFTTPSSFTNATVGHGLGATPAMIITKYRPGIGNWETWHTSLTSTQYLRLNTTAAAVTDSTVFNGRSSTTFTLGSSTWWGGGDFLAYCFSEIAGYSKFGSYTGNGSTDGPFVFTGFRPRYVMVKKSSDVGNWVIKDTARDTYNQVIKELSANTSDAEDQVNDEMDYLSNGFKLRSLQGVVNTNGATYIYAAFAEVPTKFALAR